MRNPEIPNAKPEIQNRKSTIPNPNPETQNPKFEGHNPKSRLPNPKPEIQNQKPEIKISQIHPNIKKTCVFWSFLPHFNLGAQWRATPDMFAKKKIVY